MNISENEKSSPTRLQNGTLLNNRYRIGEMLGQGGFGITYLALDKALDLRLAIKEFFPLGLAARVPGGADVVPPSGEEREAYDEGLVRFLEEARILARFDGVRGIVSVRDSFQENGTAYMVMNCLDGVTLKEYLRQKRNGTISLAEAIALLEPVMDALSQVHAAGWLHRDISPDNIIVPKTGTASLLDFGAARSALRNKSRSISVILKPGYAPEEQYRSRGEQGPWTDVYGVSATIYRCITGQTPPDALDRLHEDTLSIKQLTELLHNQVPVRIETALLKGLAINARDRYQNMADFKYAMINGERTPHQNAVAKRRRRLRIWASFRRYLAWGVLAALIAGAATAAFFRPSSLTQLIDDKPDEIINQTTEEPDISEVYSDDMISPDEFLAEQEEQSPKPTAAPQAVRENPINAANSLIEKKDYDGAIALLKDATAKNPNDPIASITLMRLYISENKFQAAEGETLRALALWPNDVRILFAAAQAAEALGKTESAIRYAKAVIERDNTYPGASALINRMSK